MITVKNKLAALESCLGSFKLSSNGQNISVACPVCKKSGKLTNKKKLSIDLSSGVYHCWVCESKGGNIGKLCLTLERNDHSSFLFATYKKKSDKNEEEIEVVEVPKLPEDFKLVYSLKNSINFKRHYNYLVNRGFDSKKMKQFRIGVSNEFKFKDRVIFPSFDREYNLNYYISRSIDPDNKMRYRNYTGKRKDVVFRQCDLDFSKILILTEGVFDLVNCPDNSTCILGSWIGDDHLLFKEIARNNTPVILCLDPDAIQKTLKIAKLLHSYCIDVKISQHKNMDFGDMSKKDINYYLANAKQYDNANLIGYLINDIRSGSIF